MPIVPSFPSKFDMDEFKRTYSNHDTLTVALPYFWEKFDREGYSIWFAEYNYPEYLKGNRVFMTCNLVSGQLQICSVICEWFWYDVHCSQKVTLNHFVFWS